MPLDKIQKALLTLSKDFRNTPRIGDLLDQIGKAIFELPPAGVRGLNDELNFYFVGARASADSVSGRSKADVSNLRRAALLARKFARPRERTSLGWDAAALEVEVRQCAASATAPAGTGLYLKGSFWAFANDLEVTWVKDAWPEAAKLVLAGYDAALNDSEACAALRTRWFGTASPQAIAEVLRKVRDGMNSRLTGIAYEGTGAASNDAGYREYTGDAGGNMELIKADINRVAYAGASTTGKIVMGCCVSFFDPRDTLVTRTSPLSIAQPNNAANPMRVTRGGGVLHELTHCFARTIDVVMTAAVTGRLASTPAGAAAYGEYRCAGLASHDPANAVKNADSYRLFCEEARLLF